MSGVLQVLGGSPAYLQHEDQDVLMSVVFGSFYVHNEEQFQDLQVPQQSPGFQSDLLQTPSSTDGTGLIAEVESRTSSEHPDTRTLCVSSRFMET